jgi:hypothetical protein
VFISRIESVGACRKAMRRQSIRTIRHGLTGVKVSPSAQKSVGTAVIRENL